MLTALELHGFKSFADRTRFEFPQGITVVVGPNGSGKSNVVDAIKWVLGTQSAKSLRGSEMTDVIFKGSSAGRKPLNTAEATIVFDNRLGHLAVEEKEVRVSRRVYRSGEGEYLINGQPCRLRDIKDLFRGTGVGSDAYSIIEQGKVSAMLQASPKDRRSIFEEAAGISRFKAKKVETERRLARVDQNMLRLSDIVDEVESRLRSVRSQASKARRYKEYSDRLQQLRTQVGTVDWRKLSDQLRLAELELAEQRAEVQQREAECVALDEQVAGSEAELAEVDQALRQTEAEIATNREQIASLQSTIEHQRARGVEIEDELARCRRQLAAMGHRAGNLDEQWRETEEAAEAASEEYARLCNRVDETSAESSRLAESLHQAQDRLAERRERRMGLLQTGAELSSNLSAAQSQLASATATLQRVQQQGERVGADLDQNGQQLREAESQLRSLQGNLHEQDRQVSNAEEDLQRAHRRLERHKEALAELKSERVRLEERSSVLSDLVERNEGVHAGVQQVLSKAQGQRDGPYADVCGMLADLMEVHVESAPIIEAALGELTQAVVVRGQALLQQFRDPQHRPEGRVMLLPLEEAPLRIESAWSSLEQQPGVIGRADRFVTTDMVYAPLIRRLLDSTWVAESLDVAHRLAEMAGEQLRFVTIDGAVLEADGRVVLGAAQQSTGFIWRRSQLRELQIRLGGIEDEIGRAGQQVAASQGEVDELVQQSRQLAELRRELADELSQQRAQVQALARSQENLQERYDAALADSQAAATARQQAAAGIAKFQQQQQANEQAAGELNAKIEHDAAQLRTLEAQHKACDLRATTAKVEAAKSEQRLDALRARLRQIGRDRHERQRALDELHLQIEQASARQCAGELDVLERTSAVSELYLGVEELGERRWQQRSKRSELQQARSELAQQIDKQRREIHRLEEKCHRSEMTAEQARSERDHLAQRLRDDYGIELAAMQSDETEEQIHERQTVEEEIDDLRRKINNIGAVNLDALNELEQLDERFNTLAGQFNDLKDSKAALEKIIQRINADSRRLFAETLEAIRGNFQALYRKLFGGGHADIVLEEGVDILEAGIEIIANPPGKPAFSNSLLSGGEQGLTAVSLLLAIFQHRPSPFCVLDEVDAPLDESNIGRFIDVLREFLDWTKFVIVTHSKKTMTAANTLYGVTMQEPNVSKRVAVRFEDVSEQGEISQQAIQRQQAAPADETGDDERAA